MDWYSDGCNAVTVGTDSDRAALATGNFLKRADNVMPSNCGQFGWPSSHTVDAWATKFGLYATQFHSRTGYSGVTKSLRTDRAAFRARGPRRLESDLLHRVARGHPHVRRAPSRPRFKGGIVFGELTYRPNQPLQFNAADLLGGRALARRADDAARQGTCAAARAAP